MSVCDTLHRVDAVPASVQATPEALLQSRSLCVLAFRHQHVERLWTVLQHDDINKSLFEQVYETSCDHIDTFSFFLWDRWLAGTHIPYVFVRRRPGGGLEELGEWFVLHSSVERDTVACALFFPEFWEEGQGEALYLLKNQVFDKLGYRVLELRRSPLLGRYDRQILGVLSRQLYVPEQGQVANLYVTTKEQWTLIKAALEAWLGSRMLLNCRHGSAG